MKTVKSKARSFIGFDEASTPSSRCSTAEWVAPQKAAVHEKTLRISHSTREKVRHKKGWKQWLSRANHAT